MKIFIYFYECIKTILIHIKKKCNDLMAQHGENDVTKHQMSYDLLSITVWYAK